MPQPIKIKWYRSPIDKAVLSSLMQTSDARAFRQVFAQLGLYLVTGTLAFIALDNIRLANLAWSLPLGCLALFIHGTCSSFLSPGGPVHELCHRTPFSSRFWNDFFVKVYSFLSWSDYVSFRPSHIKHHQVTVHHDYDGEVVLPQTLNFQSLWFVVTHLAFDPIRIYNKVSGFARAAFGYIRDPWIREVMPESNAPLRAEHKQWARIVLFGHLALAALFILSGHWWLILIFTFGAYFSGWLLMLCGTPQHIGMAPDMPDFRLCCRTYTCHWFPAFLYWNMQYHVEHHMFPAVPFYNLPRLRAAIESDLPPPPTASGPHGGRSSPLSSASDPTPRIALFPRCQCPKPHTRLPTPGHIRILRKRLHQVNSSFEWRWKSPH